MLRLKDLKLQNIARFVTPQQIDFTQLGDFVQVDAKNKNTNGSSGSGKSSIFNALDYLLGINDLPLTILQSRLTKEPIAVTAIFDWDGIELIVSRSKKGLVIEHSGKVVEGSNKIAEEELDKILGMPRELFRRAMHKRQNDGGFFLEMGPKEIYEFMASCLKLDKEQEQLEKSKKNVANLEVNISSAQSSLLAVSAQLKTVQESIVSLGMPPVKDIHQAVIIELKGKMDRSKTIYDELLVKHAEQNALLDSKRPVLRPNPELEVAEQLPDPVLENTVLDISGILTANKNEQAQITAQISALENANKEQWNKLAREIQEIDLKIHVLNNTCNTGKNAHTSALGKAGEVKKLQASICPTCEQQWVTESAKIKEKALLEEITLFRQQIAEGQVAQTQIHELYAKQQELKKQQAELTYEIPGIAELCKKITELKTEEMRENERATNYKHEVTERNNKVMDSYHTSRQAILTAVAKRNQVVLMEVQAENGKMTNEYNTMVSSVRIGQEQEKNQAAGQFEVDRRAYDAAVTKLQIYESNKSRYDESVTKLKASEAEYATRLSQEEQELVKMQANLEKAKELHLAIKTFLSVSFDQALNAIGENATEIIRCIPNMSNATIEFSGQKETKDGIVKEEVNAILSMDGEIGVPIKSLSGGERSAADLAIDLAVIDFIEMQTGTGIDLFILDEPFNGLGPVEIEMALTVLQNSNTNKRIMIVDHHSEVKQMVSDRVLVVRDGLYSTVESVQA